MGQLKFDPHHDLLDNFLYYNIYLCAGYPYALECFCHVVMVALYTVSAGEDVTSFKVVPT